MEKKIEKGIKVAIVLLLLGVLVTGIVLSIKNANAKENQIALEKFIEFNSMMSIGSENLGADILFATNKQSKEMATTMLAIMGIMGAALSLLTVFLFEEPKHYTK